MDHLWQTLIFTMVSEVGIVSSAQIWLKSHLWFESGLRWDANLTSEGRGLPCFSSILWPVSAAAFLSENRVMVQPATNCSVTLFIDSALGCCFDQIPQTTKSHPVVGSGSVFVPMNWSFWAFISVSESKYSQLCKVLLILHDFTEIAGYTHSIRPKEGLCGVDRELPGKLMTNLFDYYSLSGNRRSVADTLRSELLSDVFRAGFSSKSPPERPQDQIQLEGREQQSKYLCSAFILPLSLWALI